MVTEQHVLESLKPPEALKLESLLSQEQKKKQIKAALMKPGNICFCPVDSAESMLAFHQRGGLKEPFRFSPSLRHIFANIPGLATLFHDPSQIVKRQRRRSSEGRGAAKTVSRKFGTDPDIRQRSARSLQS